MRTLLSGEKLKNSPGKMMKNLKKFYCYKILEIIKNVSDLKKKHMIDYHNPYPIS